LLRKHEYSSETLEGGEETSRTRRQIQGPASQVNDLMIDVSDYRLMSRFIMKPGQGLDKKNDILNSVKLKPHACFFLSALYFLMSSSIILSHSFISASLYPKNPMISRIAKKGAAKIKRILVRRAGALSAMVKSEPYVRRPRGR